MHRLNVELMCMCVWHRPDTAGQAACQNKWSEGGKSRIGLSSIYFLSLLPRHMFKDCLIALHHTVGCYLAISLRNAFQKKTINTWIVDKTSIPLGLNKCASLTLFWNITILVTSEYLSGYIKACSVVFLKKRKDSKSSWPGMAAPRDYNDRGCTLKWCLDVKTI